MNRFLIDTIYLIDADASTEIVTTGGSAKVKSSYIDFTEHTGKMVRGLDSGGNAAWGIITGEVVAGYASVESMPGYDDDTFNDVELGFVDGNLISLALMITRPPYYELDGQIIKAQIRTPFEGGYVQSRPKYTRSRQQFDLEWRFATIADYNTTVDFFKVNQGGMFFLTHPTTRVIMIARFMDDELRWKWLAQDITSVSIGLEEV